ncbi:Core histone [Taenia solium]|eukprot:TsM_000349700 transcript=TsM_000349700 gene=TsM_000349700
MPTKKPQTREKAAISKSRRCGLVFPVARVRRLLKTSKLARSARISVVSVVYLTAVLEYLSSEVVDLAGRVAKGTRRKTISPRSIMLAVRADEELFKTKVLHNIKLPLGQTLQIVQTDIAELNVDAIVNPTNSTFYMGGMVGSRLMTMGGAAFAKVMDDARSNITNLQKNDAFVTKGTGIKANNVIHVNGPVWNPSHPADCISDLRKTIENCLTTAEKAGFASIALPSVGSGKANFPKSLAAETIVSTIKTCLDQGKTSLTDVRFVLFDQVSIDAYIYELNRTT